MITDGGNVRVGKPFIEGGKVTAEVAGHGRHDKVKIIKFRRRKHHMKRQGHRQWFTELRITGISGASGSSATATDTSGED
jgi:large subunit ribosomal protein L21